MIYESTIEIERPIDEVFEAASCVHRCVAWRHVLNSRLDDDGPAHVGSTFTTESRLLSITVRFKGMITDLNPPTLFAFKAIEGLPFKSLCALTPTQRGARLRIASEVEELPAPIGLVLNNRLAKKLIENMIRKELEQLKMLMEDRVDLWDLMPP